MQRKLVSVGWTALVGSLSLSNKPRCDLMVEAVEAIKEVLVQIFSHLFRLGSFQTKKVHASHWLLSHLGGSGTTYQHLVKKRWESVRPLHMLDSLDDTIHGNPPVGSLCAT